MKSSLPTLLAAALVSVAANAPAQTALNDDVRSRWETSCMIRHDKFDYVLPGAMRRNDIDMWIVIDRGRGTQPMTRDFGIATVNGQGFFIFTDRGGERIERIQLGPETDLARECGAYDRFGQPDDLRSIVEERDPATIGLNYLAVPYESEGLHIADGLTHTDFKFLTSELGEKYAARFTSAQHLIADFHGERVAGEIIEFSKVGDLTRRLIERALSNEVITPGMTTHNDVARWLEEHLKTEGLLRAWYPTVYSHRPDGNEIGGTERVIQRGDVLQIDWGAGRNNFSTDIKRFAYVLREGETEPPPDVLKTFAEAKKVQEIIRKHVRSGRTGREQFRRAEAAHPGRRLRLHRIGGGEWGTRHRGQRRDARGRQHRPRHGREPVRDLSRADEVRRPSQLDHFARVHRLHAGRGMERQQDPHQRRGERVDH